MRNHSFDPKWGVLKIVGALGIVGFNEAGALVRQRVIRNLEMSILILQDKTRPGEHPGETEEEVRKVLGGLRGWEWRALTLT